MPPRQPALPEGTDHIVAGASGSSEGENGSGFVATVAADPRAPTGWSARSATR